jgi:cellulose synthase/poly-beta-1,6-N-acetylglucosamine synthase-like glycosyltransferase
MYVIAFIVVVIISANYIYLILSYTKGWKQLSGDSRDVNETRHPTEFISVVIPVRNEQQHLNLLLERLKKQTYPSIHFEVLFINDHSSDQSAEIISENICKTDHIRLLHLEENEKGKKTAIWKGIQHSSGELIVTLDSDCIPGKKWLKTIAEKYQIHHPDMIIGPVIMTQDDNYLSHIFSLEFASLIAATVGAAGINQPIMCNGANLAFKKSLAQELSSIYHNPTASGDDIFLMEALKRNGKSISFLKKREAVVITSPPHSINHFIKQRTRWVAKSKHYKDPKLQHTAISVFAMNLVLPALLAGSIAEAEFFFIFTGTIVIKSTIDLFLLTPVIKYFKLHSLLKFKYVAPVQLLYPFYSTAIALFSLSSDFEWKDRRYKD